MLHYFTNHISWNYEMNNMVSKFRGKHCVFYERERKAYEIREFLKQIICFVMACL